MTKIPLDDYRWLTSDAATEWLESATARAAAGDSVVKFTESLRRDLTPDRTHLVLEQVELRRRARDKFAAAERMFFTRRAYEQATDEIVAAHKARRFPAGQLVGDLCCGIGGDLLALTARGPTLAIDRDPGIMLLCATNCRAAGPPGHPAHFLVADAAAADVASLAAWHIDPDRRPQGKRTTRVELHDPDAGAIERLLAQQPNAAVKLAPAAAMPNDWAERAELEWISRDGECRQLVAWFGELAERPGERQATVLNGTDDSPRTLPPAPVPPPFTSTVGRYLFEPDAAVLAAGLGGNLAAEHGLASLTRDGGYLTGDHPLTDAALACFEVTDVLPYHVRRVGTLLRERQIGRLEIKKRNVPLDVEQTRRELALSGDNAATLLLTRIGRSITTILARRV